MSAGGITPVQVFLMELDPIVYAYVRSGSPCGDPMGVEYDAVEVRLSEVLRDRRKLSAPYVQRELDRLGWNLQ